MADSNQWPQIEGHEHGHLWDLKDSLVRMLLNTPSRNSPSPTAQTATEHKGTSACFLARNTFLFSGSEMRNGEFLQAETGVGSGLLTYQTLGETMVSEPFPRLENALCRGHWHPKAPY